jgi:hypothetical protein
VSLPALPLPAPLPRPPIKPAHRPARAPVVLQTATRRRAAYAPAPERPLLSLVRPVRAVPQHPRGLPTTQHHRALPARSEAAVASLPGRRRPPFPALSHPPAAPKIEPLVPLGHPRALPRPSPVAAHRNSANPRRPAAPGATLQEPRSFRGPPCKRSTQIVKPPG